MLKQYRIKIALPILYGIAGISYCIWTLTQTAPSLLQYLGALVAVICFVLWIVARVQLADNFSIGAQANQLVTSGLYSKFRHPVYYFSVAALGGIVLVSQSWLVAVAWAILVMLEIIRIRMEDRILQKKFGDKYVQYRKKVWV